MSYVMDEPMMPLNEHLLCVRHMLGLSLISSNLPIVMHQKFLTPSPISLRLRVVNHMSQVTQPGT